VVDGVRGPERLAADRAAPALGQDSGLDVESRQSLAFGGRLARIAAD
jgi:hypothetical protein